MLTSQKCEHDDETRTRCGGFITSSEMKMHEMRPEHSAHFYHDILTLFEDTFYIVEEENGRTQQGGADQEDR